MNIIVIGDIMLDINYNSKIERSAPEADIPIYNILFTNYILGGAANVAQNLKNLETNIELISVIGNDTQGEIIQKILNEKDIQSKLFIDKERKTTQKNRIFKDNSIKVRYDIEDTNEVNNNIIYDILTYIINKKDINIIVISDYAKGLITNELCEKIIDYSNKNNIYTFIDPKTKNYTKYKNCFCFKPNLIESEYISGEKNIQKMFDFIKININCENIILTSGEKGIFVNTFLNNIKHNKFIDVIDVTGAGDVVLSVLVYIFFIYKDIMLASKIANYVAGKSVRTIGNYKICLNDINEYFNINTKEPKIIYDYEDDKIKQIKNNNKDKKIIFTNGCFDILHSAHIKLFQYAKQQGDILVVGLNSDDSIRRLKGPTRPINSIDERSIILSLFEFIDYIIIFNDDTPLNIIKTLLPNIIVKGSDYVKENIIGIEYVEDVLLFDYIKNKSTSLIIEKIIK
jgi:D-beta-D-heptose 7-phosphate kinase/D-beta-D-heptose 1-phosphate adenosyltransferase